MERKPKRNHGLNNGAFLYHLQNTLNISWTERRRQSNSNSIRGNKVKKNKDKNDKRQKTKLTKKRKKGRGWRERNKLSKRVIF